MSRFWMLVVPALLAAACAVPSDAGTTPEPTTAPAAVTTVPATTSPPVPTTAPSTMAPSTTAPPPKQVEAVCAVTVPDGGFVPPDPYPAAPPPDYGMAWYGSPALWTMLQSDGERWSGLPVQDAKLGNKLVFFTEGYDVHEDPMPDLTVRARRLDGPGEAVHPPPATNAMVPEIGWFIMTGIELPSPGCWELTASYNGAELSFVAEVMG